MNWLYKKCLKVILLMNNTQLDLGYRLAKEASDESFEYAKNNMMDAVFFSRRENKPVLEYGLDQIKNSGLILEFGVAKGATISIIAKKLPDKKIHGFDSFYGLLNDWDGHEETKGAYSTYGKLPKVPRNVELHKGLFEKTLPNFVKNHNEKIAFIHIDCDFYPSTKTVFDNLAGKIQKGTIIVFDDISIMSIGKNMNTKRFKNM